MPLFVITTLPNKSRQKVDFGIANQTCMSPCYAGNGGTIPRLVLFFEIIFLVL